MSRRMLGGVVAFPVPPEVAFDYLVDPHHRPEWQSSLKAVADVDGEPRVGQRWTDVTVPGIRPAMRTTAYERPVLWSETGTWHGVAADLTLRLSPTASGCDVAYRFRIRLLGPVGLLATAVSVLPVRTDLRHAADVLSRRS